MAEIGAAEGIVTEATDVVEHETYLSLEGGEVSGSRGVLGGGATGAVIGRSRGVATTTTQAEAGGALGGNHSKRGERGARIKWVGEGTERVSKRVRGALERTE